MSEIIKNSNMKEFLSTKKGPLPVWGWLLLTVVIITAIGLGVGLSKKSDTKPPVQIVNGIPIVSVIANIKDCPNMSAGAGCYDGYDGDGTCYIDNLRKSCAERGYTVYTGKNWNNLASYPYAKVYSKP